MNNQKANQRVDISGHNAQTGDIIQIKELGQLIQYITKLPPQWQETIWDFLVDHRICIFIGSILEFGFYMLYKQYKDFYLISPWYWFIGAILLATAIWGWNSWFKSDNKKESLIQLIITTCLLIAIVGWQAWQIVFPKRFHQQTFSIVFAELGAGADSERTDQTRQMSDIVYQKLCNTIENTFDHDNDNCKVVGKDSNIPLLEVRLIGVIPDEEKAKEYGKKVGADFIIWGELVTENDQTVIRFELIEVPDNTVHRERPLVLPVVGTNAELLVYGHNDHTYHDANPAKLEQVVAPQATIISSYALGLSRYLERDYKKAVTLFETARNELDNSSLDISKGKRLLYFYLGQAYNNIGRLEDGREALLYALEKNDPNEPDEPAIHIALALGYQRAKQLKKRGEHLTKAYHLIETLLERDETNIAAIYDRGLIHQLNGDFEHAFEDFQKVIEHYNAEQRAGNREKPSLFLNNLLIPTQFKSENQNTNHYIAHLSAGQAAIELGYFERAHQLLRYAITLAEESGKNRSWAHLHLARVYEEENKPDLAQKEYLLAIDLDREVSWMYYYYAQFLEKQQHNSQDIQLNYQKMIEVEQADKGWAISQWAGYLKRRGISLEEDRLIENAIKKYQEALTYNDEDVIILTELADAYVRINELDNAKDYLQRAVALNTPNYYVYSTYGDMLYRAEDFEGAVEMYKLSLGLRKSNGPVLFNLGNAYRYLQQDDKAHGFYCQILELSEELNQEIVEKAYEQLNNTKLINRCK